ncbi:MAG: helix-turn-helix transcriptional regulator [Bacteroidales bacterium]|nr:helix-turn-helix transcriptional regulator [Bacteroidales bacterium]
MNLKFLFAAISFCWFAFLALKWWRSRTSLSGNEMIVLPVALVPVVLFSGDYSACAMRMALFSSMFGGYILWSAMLKKGRKPEIPVFVYAIPGIFLYEAAVWFMEVERVSVFRGYTYLNILMWALLFLYAYMMKGRHRALKGSISTGKLLDCFAVAVPFVVLSGITMAVLQGCGGCDVFSRVVIFVFLGMFLWYMHYEKPACLEVKQLNELVVVRRKGYMLGKVVGSTLMLEDDGNSTANEGVVEDSRIIYALMALFAREKLYRNADIKIGNVALMIGTNKTYLSRALNTRLSKNFCQFVNYYRVREACELFIQTPNIEMRELAEQCGFSSGSNFSIVFKFNTGFTPGDWCRMIKMKLESNEPVCVDDYLL